MLLTGLLRLFLFSYFRGLNVSGTALHPSQQSQYQRDSQKYTAAFFGAIALVVAVINLILLSGNLIWQARFRSEGMTTAGVVDSVEVPKDPGDLKTTTLYHFDLAGTNYHATQTSTFTHNLQDTIQVHYLKSDPNQNYLDPDQNEDWRFVLQVVFIVVGAGVAVFGVCEWNRLSAFDKSVGAVANPAKPLEASVKTPPAKVEPSLDSRLMPLADVELNSLTSDRSR